MDETKPMSDAAAERQAKLLTALDGCRIRKPHKSKHPERAKKVDEAFLSKFSRYVVNTNQTSSAAVYRMCGKKVRYRSLGVAKKQIHTILKYRPNTNLRAYYCDLCKGWHLTHKEDVKSDFAYCAIGAEYAIMFTVSRGKVLLRRKPKTKKGDTEMSTRTVIRVVEPWGDKFDIYHHTDGYPEGVGFDIYRRLRERKEKGGYIDGESFINGLVKDKDEHYEFTTGIHSDIEYLYIVTMPKTDEGEARITCYHLCGSFEFRIKDGEYNQDAKARMAGLYAMWEKQYEEYKAEQAQAKAQEAAKDGAGTPAIVG